MCVCVCLYVCVWCAFACLLNSMGTCMDLADASVRWTSHNIAGWGKQYSGMPSDPTPMVNNMVLNILDGGDGNSNSLVAVELGKGSVVWEFPPSDQVRLVSGWL